MALGPRDLRLLKTGFLGAIATCQGACMQPKRFYSPCLYTHSAFCIVIVLTDFLRVKTIACVSSLPPMLDIVGAHQMYVCILNTLCMCVCVCFPVACKILVT